MALFDSSAVVMQGRSEFRKCPVTNAPIFGLDLSCILENADVDEEVPGRFEVAGKVDVSPVALVRGQEVTVLPNVVLFLRAKAAGRAITTTTTGHTIHCRYLLASKVHNIGTAPNKLF